MVAMSRQLGDYSNQPPPGIIGSGHTNVPSVPGMNTTQYQQYSHRGGASGFAGNGRQQGELSYGSGGHQYQMPPAGMGPPGGVYMPPGVMPPPVIGGRGRGRGPPFMGGRMGGTRFCAVKLRGLPFGVKEYEIGMFLVCLCKGFYHHSAYVSMHDPKCLNI